MKREELDTKRAAVEPPKGLEEKILAALRAEKARRRNRMFRNFAAVAAALLLLTPAATRLLPRLTEVPTESTADHAVPPADLALDLTGANGPAVPTGEETAGAETEPPTPPPDYVGKTEAVSSADSVMAMSTGAASSAEEDPGAAEPPLLPLWMETLTHLVGEEAIKQWMTLYEGDPYAPEAEAAAYAYFRLDA